jgi:hypothetical protein
MKSLNKLWITQWVQKVNQDWSFLQQLSLVYSNSPSNLYSCSLKPPWHKINIMHRLFRIFSMMYFFSQIQVDRFVTTSVLLVQQTRTQKQTGNVASAQDVLARTALTRQFTQHAAIARNSFTHIPALNYGFLSSKMSGISLYVTA